jgi:hypothetical protein
MTFGVQKAISDMGQFMKDHPVAVGAAGVGLAAASAVCPFLGGLAAGTAGVGMATRFLNGGSSSKTADQ